MQEFYNKVKTMRFWQKKFFSTDKNDRIARQEALQNSFQYEKIVDDIIKEEENVAR